MSMDNAEQLIAQWRDKLAAISRNVNELAETECVKRIRIRLQEGRYQGDTKVQAQHALAELPRLMDDYVLLARVLDEAIQIHNGGMFSSRDTKWAKIDKLLNGPSVQKAVQQVPLAQRQLVGVAESALYTTPSTLLAEMASAFEASRNTLFAIDHAETEGRKELLELKQAYQAMQERAAQLGWTAEPPRFIELADLQSDPLNASAGLAALRRNLQTWAQGMVEAQDKAHQATADLQAARQQLQHLQSLDAQRAEWEAQASALEGDAQCAAYQGVAEQMPMLTAWCGNLQTHLQAGRWEAVRVGVVAYSRALQEAISSTERAVAAAQKPQRQWDNLQGLFVALKAKQRALSGGVAVQELEALKSSIEAALAQRPVAWDVLQAQIQQYQSRVSALGRG